jgi:hypothetical protein
VENLLQKNIADGMILLTKLPWPDRAFAHWKMYLPLGWCNRVKTGGSFASDDLYIFALSLKAC